MTYPTATREQVDALARALCACMGCDPDDLCSDAGHTSADVVASAHVPRIAKLCGFGLPAAEPDPYALAVTDLFDAPEGDKEARQVGTVSGLAAGYGPAPAEDSFLSRRFGEVV